MNATAIRSSASDDDRGWADYDEGGDWIADRDVMNGRLRMSLSCVGWSSAAGRAWLLGICTLIPLGWASDLHAQQPGLDRARAALAGSAATERSQSLDEPAAPRAEATTNAWTLDQLVDWACLRNPAIEIARQEVQQARARVPQAAALADPMLGVNAWPFNPAVPQTAGGRMRAEVMLSQAVPWRGKLRTREEVASAELAAAEYRLRQMELQVKEEVTVAYLARWGSRVEAQLWEQDLQSLEELLRVIDALYRTGRVGQQDALQTTAELGLSRGELAAAQERVVRSEAELLRVLHWPRQEPLAISDILPPSPAPIDLNNLLDAALASRPEVIELQVQIQRDMAQVQQMRLEYYPDLNFRVGWGEMTTQGAIAPFADGVDSITTGLELNLPVRRARRAAAVAEAEARLVATGNRLEQVQDETIRDVRQVQAEDQRIADQLTLYRQQIVPPMEQAWQVTLSGYQVGQATFNDLITIRRQLIRLKQAETQLIVQQHSTRARLERLVPALTTGL